MLKKRPYLIAPTLIEQPTWGGSYILQYKGWTGRQKETKIGQSYELYSKSLLLSDIDDSQDERFGSDTTVTSSASARLEREVQENPTAVIGKKIVEKFGKMPLLVKFNQAKGNSFQLHKKPGTQDGRWKSKAESWYYLEDGKLTFGVREGCNVSEYKSVCLSIERFMKGISASVLSGNLALEKAKQQAKEMIRNANPWQFVNVHTVRKYECVDLSMGGLHHSWEEDPGSVLGNVVYEVQEDVMDDQCTVRSFDQGKLKDDGSIRMIAVEDYFRFLDTDPVHNDFTGAKQKKVGQRLLSAPQYALDMLEPGVRLEDRTNGSFVHLWVREGDVDIVASDGSVHLTQGHSCFIPESVQRYEIKPRMSGSVLLKTFIDVQ